MRKFLASLLCVMMVFCMMPGMAFAEGTENVVEVATYEELLAALENDNANIKMTADITADATQGSGYGKAGIVLNAGDVLDGNGHMLTINGANTTWDCAVAMKGGEVKNLTIDGAFRGVFMPGANGDVVIDNCVFENVTYTFNSDAGSKDYSVTIKNSALNGWTSFSDVHKSVAFEGCTFSEGSGYAFCRPYQATTFTDCVFEKGFELDTTEVDDGGLAFDRCTYDGLDISADNNDMFYNGGIVMINGVSTDVTQYVAKIGEEDKYLTLEDALAVANEGDTIILLDDVVLTSTLVIPADKTMTLDLNGKVVSGVETSGGKASAVIVNNGNLTIVDSGNGGKITSEVSDPDSNPDHPFPYYANNTISNHGTLILESGTIENTTVGGACYPIDNYQGASVIINGGTVESASNVAIRLFANSKTLTTSVTVNDGLVKGKRAIWIQLPGSASDTVPPVEVKVTGGILESIGYTSNGEEYKDAIYSYTYGNSFGNTNITIEGGTFVGEVAFTGGTLKTPTENVVVSGGTFDDVYSYGEMNPFITGGTFANDPSAYVMDNYDVYKYANGKYVVDDEKPANTNSNYKWVEKDGIWVEEYPAPSYSGGGYVSIEKPEITADAGADYNLSILGTTLTITAKDGYELVDVTLNGVSKGAVTELKGLKTSDKVVIVTKAIGSEEPVADEAQLVARSQMSKAKGKKAIKVYWFNEDGSELTYDGYEIFRSTKRFKGYGTKPIFETEREAYWNTDIELGTKYYYKVRGYNVVDGEKEYSEWSLKAWRVAE